MKYKIGSIAAILLLTSCGSDQQDGLASAFPELQDNHLEIRLGNMPELTGGQCNRNMYAGFRSNSGETIKLTIDLAIAAEGSSIQRYERELLLEKTSRGDLVAGQNFLFPESIEQACDKIHLTMFTMSCAYGPEMETRACPLNRKWQWLQGFKMVEIPKAR